MRILFIAFLLLCSSLSHMAANAKSMQELWMNMPQHFTPYLNQDLRSKLLLKPDSVSHNSINNLLGGTTTLDSLTTHYMHIQLSKAATLSLLLLPTANSDSIICMVQTYKGDQPESTVSFFTQEWQEIDNQQLWEGKSLQDMQHELLVKPKEMSEARFKQLVAIFNPMLIEVTLSPNDNTAALSPHPMFVTEEDKKDFHAIFLQRKFKWDGKMFKKVIINHFTNKSLGSTK